MGVIESEATFKHFKIFRSKYFGMGYADQKIKEINGMCVVTMLSAESTKKKNWFQIAI